MILAELTLDAALAATATLVATALRGGRAGALAGPPPPPRAGLDDLAADVRRRLRGAVAGRGRRLVGPDLPRLLPVRRHPERAVAGPRDRLPAGRAAPRGRRAVGPRHRVRLRRRGDGRPHRCTAPSPPTSCPRDGTCSRPSPASWRPSGREWPPSSSSAARCGRRGGCGAAAPAPAAAPTSRRRASRSATSSSRSAPSSLGQRHARRPAGQGHGVRADARDRRRHPLLRLPRRHARAREPRRRLPRRHRPAAGPLEARSACTASRSAARARRRTLPERFRGSSSTNITFVGHL